ncbi:MAG: MFS transporter [Sporolactobacillus sp.]
MKKVSFLFFAVMFVIGTDTFLISPLLPTLTALYKIPANLSGWMVSAYALGYAVFALIVGPISDGMDRKKLMIGGLISFSIATFLCGLAPNFWMMLLFRLLAGISAAVATPQIWAAIPMLFGRESMIKVMGQTTAGLSIAQMVGLPIGSYLAARTWSMPFFAIAVCTVLLVLGIFYVIPALPPRNQATYKLSLFHTYGQLFKAPRAVKFFIAYFIFQAGNFEAFSFIGTWFSSNFSLDVTAIGSAMILLGLGNATGSLFGNRLIRKLGEQRSLFLSLILLIGLYSFLPFSRTLAVAIGLLFLIFMIGGFVFPVFMSQLQSLTTTAKGTVSALANSIMYAGTTIGGMIGSILISRFSGFFGVSWFTAVTYVLSLSIYARVLLSRESRSSKRTDCQQNERCEKLENG